MAHEELKTVFITGASGFIGRALRSRLRGSYQLVCIDKAPMEIQPNEICMEIDLETDSGITDLDKTLNKHGPRTAAFIHLAAYYDFSNRPHPSCARLTEALPRILASFAKWTKSESRFVFASSMSAIAPTRPGEKIDPNGPKLAVWEYPKSKVACEAILDEFPMKQPVFQLVLAAVYSDYCELVPLYHHFELISGMSPEKYFYPGNSQRD